MPVEPLVSAPCIKSGDHAGLYSNRRRSTALAVSFLRVATLVFGQSTCIGSDGGGTWSRLADLHEGRYGAAAVALNDSVYVAGGHCNSCVYPNYFTDSVEVYDRATNAWAFVSSMPFAAYQQSAVAVDGKIILLGGLDTSLVIRRDVIIYDPAADAWSSGTPMPDGVVRPGVVVHDKSLFVIGGFSESGQDHATWRYDIAADRWERRADHLCGVVSALGSAVVIGPFIYLVGTFDCAGIEVNTCQRYDPVADEWRLLPNMPTARRACVVASIGGRAFAIGGMEGGGIQNEGYDPIENEWLTYASLPQARWESAAAILQSGILVIGGSLTGDESLARVDCFRPPDSASIGFFCDCVESAPCHNTETVGGCTNSTGRGAIISALGSSSVALDNLRLFASRLPEHQPGFAFMGAGHAPTPFGDGLRCISANGGTFRFDPSWSGSEGVLTLGPGIVRATSQCSGCSIIPGSTWVFQFVFRDPEGPCGSFANASSAAAVTFGL